MVKMLTVYLLLVPSITVFALSLQIVSFAVPTNVTSLQEHWEHLRTSMTDPHDHPFPSLSIVYRTYLSSSFHVSPHFVLVLSLH